MRLIHHKIEIRRYVLAHPECDWNWNWLSANKFGWVSPKVALERHKERFLRVRASIEYMPAGWFKSTSRSGGGGGGAGSGCLMSREDGVAFQRQIATLKELTN
jgi:hypothetical protein